MSSVYDFGFLDQIVGINFPSKSKPWFWYYPVQKPVYWSYVSPQAGGHGWQVGPFFGIIKILPIDTQPFVPVPNVGWKSLEDAMAANPLGGKDQWGRFNFQDNFFWKVIGKDRPRNRVTGQVIPVPYKNSGAGKQLDAAVKDWHAKWTITSDRFNLSVTDKGLVPAAVPFTAFALPLPPTPNIPELERTRGQWYLGPIPGGFNFGLNEGTAWDAAIFKQAYSFRIALAQLDPKKWDMSVFPPREYPRDLNAKRRKGQYGGYNPFGVNFPLSGPQITGI